MAGYLKWDGSCPGKDGRNGAVEKQAHLGADAKTFNSCNLQKAVL
jgi:hypothetical protein